MKKIFLMTAIISTIIYADFTKNNGVVTDSRTTLQWQDDYSDNAGSIKQTTWTAAIDYCEALSLDGGGWRLPNKKELLSIVDYNHYSPSINTVFTNTSSSYYWSATTHAASTSVAWVVYFSNGYTTYDTKSANRYVRCVR